ncbi:TPA: transcriptional regulator [Escherichia coli]|nr:transcriptional regulator [Escherichia coli]HDY2306524.1 transcriptional regulator [Escherichia coli]
MDSDNKLIKESKCVIRKRCYRSYFIEAGTIDKEHFWLLIDISSIHSQRIIDALYDYVVEGCSRKAICEKHHINNGYFSTCLKRLNNIHKIIFELSKFYIDDRRNEY